MESRRRSPRCSRCPNRREIKSVCAVSQRVQIFSFVKFVDILHGRSSACFTALRYVHASCNSLCTVALTKTRSKGFELKKKLHDEVRPPK